MDTQRRHAQRILIILLLLSCNALANTEKPKYVNGNIEFLSREGQEPSQLQAHETSGYAQADPLQLKPLHAVYRKLIVIDDFCFVVTERYTREERNFNPVLTSAMAQVTRYNYYGDILWDKDYKFTKDDILISDDELLVVGYGIRVFTSPENKAIILIIGGDDAWGLDHRFEAVSYEGETLSTLRWDSIDLMSIRDLWTLPVPGLIAIEGRRGSGYIILVWSVQEDKVIQINAVGWDEVIYDSRVPGKIKVGNQETKKTRLIEYPVGVTNGN